MIIQTENLKTNNISVIIYNDQRVSIGDKNTIKGSTIASEITK